MLPPAHELIETFKTEYQRYWGKGRYFGKRAVDGQFVGIERWVELWEWLNLNEIPPSVYFSVLFQYQSKRKGPRAKSVAWYASDAAKSVALQQLKLQALKTNRENPWLTLEQRIKADIKSNFDVLHQFRRTYPDPVQARQAACSQLTPYFWVFDYYFLNGYVRIDTATHLKVIELHKWLIAQPSALLARIKAHYDELAAQ